MKTHEVIEKFYNELSAPELLFLLWVRDRHRMGVSPNKIRYPHLSDSHMRKTLSKLEKLEAIIWKHKRSYNSTIKPCL